MALFLLFLWITCLTSLHAASAAGPAAPAGLRIFEDIQGPKVTLDYGYHSLENIRSSGGTARYANQDCAALAYADGDSVLGIFDGHGECGGEIATLVRDHIPKMIFETPSSDDSEARCINAFHDMQTMLKKDSKAELSGTTAAICWVQKNGMTIAHAGDSRIVVVCGEQVSFATEDHKVSDYHELARIRGYTDSLSLSHAGSVLYAGRREGKCLYSISRALGDNDGQGTILTHKPLVNRVPLSEECTVVLGTDGLWDKMSNEEVVKLVVHGHNHQNSMHTIAQDLVVAARKKGSSDDITALLAVVKKTE